MGVSARAVVSACSSPTPGTPGFATRRTDSRPATPRTSTPHYGLTAVRAKELTRAAIFAALYERRTYGTTGAKVILDFSVNGAPMGSRAPWQGAPRANVGAIGTDGIELVELLRWQPGQGAFAVVHRWQPSARELSGVFVDEDGRPGAIYYVRLRQRGEIRGRPVMAWSSAVWVGK